MGSSSRFLAPTTPGGLLSPNAGDELTPDEELVVQAIAAGTYFVDWAVPTGAINDVNNVFTLASEPSPATSLFVSLNGQVLKETDDYSLSGTTLTLVSAPPTGSLLQVQYRFSPV